MTTFVELTGEVQPAVVIVALYNPALAVETLKIEGFCSKLVKPFGPVQEYVAIPGALLTSVRFNVLPLHKSLLLLSVGAGGADGSCNI